MCQVNPGKVDYVKYRYWLLHDPNCTKTAMKHINENDPFASLGIHIHVHESPVAVDFSEPFGAILWHQRVNTGYPLCVASAFMGMSVEDLIRLEMGWALPDKEKLDGILAAMSFFYGFDPLQFFRLIKRGDEYRQEMPVDLSEYLGLELSERTLQLMPRSLYDQRKPSFFERYRIDVIGQSFDSGIEFPQCVIWSDGRIFKIEKIDSAQEHAHFATGGIGTRFSCWLNGKQRFIGYEEPGDWFVESPQYAS